MNTTRTRLPTIVTRSPTAAQSRVQTGLARHARLRAALGLHTSPAHLVSPPCRARTVAAPTRTRPLAIASRFMRSFSSSTIPQHQAPVKEPHPHGALYYHVFEDGDTPHYALSFLERRPRTSTAREVLGWLPATAADVSLDDFRTNPEFVKVLHDAIRKGLEEGVDDVQKNGALQLQSGWMHIHDQRNIPALGRIGDPDDIIGSVLVEDGQILAETYQALLSYRLCTRDGVLQLTPGLAERLKKALEEEGG